MLCRIRPEWQEEERYIQSCISRLVCAMQLMRELQQCLASPFDFSSCVHRCSSSCTSSGRTSFCAQASSRFWTVLCGNALGGDAGVCTCARSLLSCGDFGIIVEEVVLDLRLKREGMLCSDICGSPSLMPDGYYDLTVASRT